MKTRQEIYRAAATAAALISTRYHDQGNAAYSAEQRIGPRTKECWRRSNVARDLFLRLDRQARALLIVPTEVQ